MTLYLQQGDGQLGHGHGEAEDGGDVEDVERPLREVEQVERGVEHLVSRAHAEQHRPGGVVQSHHRVGRGVVELVARLALKNREKVVRSFDVGKSIRLAVRSRS